jgi:hypothetical protein
MFVDSKGVIRRRKSRETGNAMAKHGVKRTINDPQNAWKKRDIQVFIFFHNHPVNGHIKRCVDKLVYQWMTGVNSATGTPYLSGSHGFISVFKLVPSDHDHDGP